LYALCLPTKDIDFDNGTKENNFFFTLLSVNIYFILGLFKFYVLLSILNFKSQRAIFQKIITDKFNMLVCFFMEYGIIKIAFYYTIFRLRKSG